MASELQTAFFEHVEKEQSYLAGGDYSFEELLQMSQRDRRVRNAFVFYVLSRPDYKNKLWSLANRSLHCKRLVNSLHKSLLSTLKEQFHREETKTLAKELLAEHFENKSIVFELNTYDTAAEMEKFLSTVVNTIMMKKLDTTEKREKRKLFLEKIDFNNLLIPQK